MVNIVIPRILVMNLFEACLTLILKDKLTITYLILSFKLISLSVFLEKQFFDSISAALM